MSWRFASDPGPANCRYANLSSLLRGLKDVYRERESECQRQLLTFRQPLSSEARRWSLDEYQQALSELHTQLLGGESKFGSGFSLAFQNIHVNSVDQLLQAEFGYGAVQKTYQMVRNNVEGGYAGVVEAVMRQYVRQQARAAMLAQVRSFLRQLEDRCGILHSSLPDPGYSDRLERYFQAELELWGEYKRLARDILPEELVDESDAATMAQHRIEDFLVEYPLLLKRYNRF